LPLDWTGSTLSRWKCASATVLARSHPFRAEFPHGFGGCTFAGV